MKCKAYFTVEASILTPFIFLILIWVIYLGFFLYDRCLLTQDAYIMAMAESRNYYRSNVRMYRNIKEAEENWEWGKYAAFQREDMTVEAGKGMVTIAAGGVVKTPFRFPFLKRDQWEIDIVRQSKIINPVIVMRSYKKIQEKINLNGKEEENAKGNY